MAATPLHGEGPWWDVQGDVLLWVDIVGKQVHRSAIQRGTDIVIDMPEMVGAVVARQAGGLAVLLESGFAGANDAGEIEWLARIEEGPTNRFNDGKCDPQGRFLGGTMSVDVVPAAGSLYRLDSDHLVTRVLEGVSISNGLAWTADGRTMFFIDSYEQSVRAYGYDPETGAVGRSRRIVEMSRSEGVPDGMTIDVDGALWVAMNSGGTVRRYSPSGRLDTIVEVPVSGVTSCIFGGGDLAELFITTSPYGLSESQRNAQPDAGAIFVCRPGVSGRPETPFHG